MVDLAWPAAFGSPPAVKNWKPPTKNITKNAIPAAGASKEMMFLRILVISEILAGSISCCSALGYCVETVGTVTPPLIIDTPKKVSTSLIKANATRMITKPIKAAVI